MRQTDFATAGYNAARKNVARVDADSLQAVLRVSGDGALDLLNRLTPGKLFYLQPFSASHTVLLNDALRLVDVVQILNMEDHYLVLATRSKLPQLLAMLRNEAMDHVTITDESDQVAVIGIEGPYSWQLLRDRIGQDILGLRLHSIMPFAAGPVRGQCLRSGSTGEYGYRLIVPRAEVAKLLATLDPSGCLPVVSRGELSILCQETHMPVMDISVFEGDCPLELGLRYMMDFRKTEYRSHEALLEASTRAQRAVVAFELIGQMSDESLLPANSEGLALTLNGNPCGHVRFIGWSPARQKVIGYASVGAHLALPGNTALEIGGARLKTVSSPIVSSLSSRVSME